MLRRKSKNTFKVILTDQGTSKYIWLLNRVDSTRATEIESTRIRYSLWFFNLYQPADQATIIGKRAVTNRSQTAFHSDKSEILPSPSPSRHPNITVISAAPSAPRTSIAASIANSNQVTTRQKNVPKRVVIFKKPSETLPQSRVDTYEKTSNPSLKQLTRQNFFPSPANPYIQSLFEANKPIKTSESVSKSFYNLPEPSYNPQ
jgi:hypothetical protein